MQIRVCEVSHVLNYFWQTNVNAKSVAGCFDLSGIGMLRWCFMQTRVCEVSDVLNYFGRTNVYNVIKQ